MEELSSLEIILTNIETDAISHRVHVFYICQSTVEWRLSGDAARNFPYTAAPVLYSPPSSADVAEKVAEAGTKSQFSRNVSAVQRKGYTSDEELEELDSPLTSIIERLPSSSAIIMANGNGKHKEYAGNSIANARYELLREVWSA